MDIIEALDTIFDFFPRHILTELKNEGFYQPILEGRVKEGAEIYDILEEKHSSLQDSDYAWLARAIKPFLKTGSILQIGCGRGNLLKSLAESGFRPIYGIDRSRVMLEAAGLRLKDSTDCFLIQNKIENLNFSGLNDVNNVIINNFWGMVCEERSRQLLDGLKKCINGNSLVFIGPYEERKMDNKKRMAEEIAREKIGFTLAYPFFKDFSGCGYDSEIADIGQKKYFILKLNKYARPAD